MSVGLLITAYEEGRKPDKLERAMSSALHPEVDELLIYDDGSSDAYATEVRVEAWKDRQPQVAAEMLNVRYVHGKENLGVFGAKLSAIRAAESEWVQSLDSDNWLPTEYWDRLLQESRVPRRMLSPSFAKPNFDYRPVEGRTWDRDSTTLLQKSKHMGCVANTGNQFFHRPMMLRVMDRWRTKHNEMLQHDYFGRGTEHTLQPSLKWRNVYDSADSFFFNKCWLLAGNEVYIVPGLHYEHEVHSHSSWQAAPPEKEALPAIYFTELHDARCGRQFDYTLKGYYKLNNRRCVMLNRKNTVRPGATTIYVDMQDFTILKEE